MIRSALAFLVLFWAAPALAFELTTTSTGADVRVLNFPIVYDAVDAEPFALARASRRAFDTWSATSGGVIQPSYRGTTTESMPMDGITTIALLDPWDVGFGEVERTVAHTEVFYDVPTGETTESDVFLNAERFRFGTAEPGVFDTESVVLHELGHALGVAHSCGDPGRTYDSCFNVDDTPPGRRLEILEAVMAPTLSTGTERRRPNADDRSAIAVHYQPSRIIRVPRLIKLTRDCPDDVLRVEGVDLVATDDVSRRFDDGRVEALAVTLEDTRFVLPSDLTGEADLVVRDPATGAYGSLVVAQIPEACEPEPEPEPPPDESCGCRASKRAPTHAWIVMILLAVLRPASRHRGPRSAMLETSDRSSPD